MRIFRDLASIPATAKGSVVALGNFDGIHRGHAAVIGELMRIAAELGARSAVVTFEPHPRQFFAPDQPPFQLTPAAIKARLLEGMGIDDLFSLHFDAAMAGTSAQSFVDDILVGAIGARHVVCGHNFVFGKGRAGDLGMLASASARGAFGLTTVGPVKERSGREYSSTNIRNFLTEGQPENAASMLGRPWEIEGEIVHGDERGRTIGFPTANIGLGQSLHPALGVYAVWAGLADGGGIRWYPAVANIGRRPTFGGETVSVEVHLFDFAGDIYGQVLRVALVGFIRPEQKFSGIDEIRAQIERDCGSARGLLADAARNAQLAPPDAGHILPVGAPT